MVPQQSPPSMVRAVAPPLLTASHVPATDASPSCDHEERDADVPRGDSSSSSSSRASSVGDFDSDTTPQPHIKQQSVPDYVHIEVPLSQAERKVSVRVRAGVGVSTLADRPRRPPSPTDRADHRAARPPSTGRGQNAAHG